ncbi:MAG TPA: ATPase, T2SS/T4P/T4SS family [Candidatus Saccharimonadales bacterium]|jgi:type IV pilus assembly protein PilB
MSVLSEDTQQSVKDSLIKDGVLKESQLIEAKEKAAKEHQSLLTELVNGKYITSEQLAKYVAHANSLPYVNLRDAFVEQSALELLPKDIAEHYMAVPLGEIENKIIIAMLDADNVQAVDFLQNKIGRAIKVYAASEEGIKNVLKQYKIKIDNSAVEQYAGEEGSEAKSAVTTADKNIKTIVQDSPISKALSTILEYAATNRASDIHMEPTETELRIRCRVDGVLREIMKLPKSTEPALVSRVKILANLKIDEHRIPQDGEFSIQEGTSKIDLRISISPVVWGEQIVIRLLDKSGTKLRLEDMGYRGRTLRAVRKGITATSGMVLTSGPTGSGKSTSLYALLQELKSDSVNIITMEDPVEYKMDGINQIQVNPEVGLTFATGLRSILRQDPDIIMVGEIRDRETAELAIQAALTGHLVFSTLHTNSAAGILPRLLDMGVEPFLIASTIRTVIGQRLIRRVAADHEEYQSSAVETEAIKKVIGRLLPADSKDIEAYYNDIGYNDLPLQGQNAYTLVRGNDSPHAPGGYEGRMGIYEAFVVTPAIQELILKRATSNQIEEVARREGMISMREDGYLKAVAKQTTIQEINRVASEDV